MFTLRKITGIGVQLNFYLGKSYTLVTKSRNPNEFEEARKKLGYDDDETFGFISDEDGHSFALFPKQQNYIMINGQTVDHITKD